MEREEELSYLTPYLPVTRSSHQSSILERGNWSSQNLPPTFFVRFVILDYSLTAVCRGKRLAAREGGVVVSFVGCRCS
jgi:hypothetical protein